MNYSLSTLLPRTSKISTIKQAGVWNHLHDISSSDWSRYLYSHIFLEQNNTIQNGYVGFYDVSDALLEDINSLIISLSIPSAIIDLKLNKLHLGVFPMMLGINKGLLGTTHNWIVQTLSEEIVSSDEITYPLDTGRINDIGLNITDFSREYATLILLEWADHFFYYCRARATMVEVASSIVDICRLAVVDAARIGWMRLANRVVTNITYWANYYDESIARNGASYFKGLFESAWLSDEFKKDAGSVLSSAVSRFTDKPASHWAKETLDKYDYLLTANERIRLIGTASNGELVYRHHWSMIAQSIDALSHDLSQDTSRKSLEYTFRVARFSDTLHPILFAIVNAGEEQHLRELFCRLYNDPTQVGRNSALTWAFTSTEGDMVYISPSGKQNVERSTDLVALTDVANSFLGTNVTVSGEHDNNASPPVRPGIPSDKPGSRFLKLLIDYYGIRANTALFSDRKNLGEGIAFFPALQHPIQPIMIRQLGWSSPVVASLEDPLPMRKLGRVAIWCGGSITEQYELEAVNQIFLDHGIEVTVYNDKHRNTKDCLKAVYTSAEFDVVWIISHGRYDHWNPEQAGIQLSEVNGFITLDELLEFETPGDSRRLLILNLCDGGTTATVGGLHRTGIAPSLTNSKQSVISHIWPVEPLVAAVFGSFLSYYLSEKHDPMQAFNSAVLHLMDERYSIYEYVRSTTHKQIELPDRINRSSVEFGDFRHWASPIYFE